MSLIAIIIAAVFIEGKPVLRSTNEDRVFVYFADHGGVGLVAMPAGDPVYAQDLIDTLRYMWTNDMYKELVFYMEACESGSMFEGLLPTDANIYATTAANSHESSYGTYCGRNSSVDGTVRPLTSSFATNSFVAFLCCLGRCNACAFLSLAAVTYQYI